MSMTSPRAIPRSIPRSPHERTALQPSSPPPSATSPPSKRELASWWKKFRKQEKAEEKAPYWPTVVSSESDRRTVERAPAIFGVPLAESIRYANVAISLTNEHGESFIYGYVPIVVAKCGVFLKEKATDVEGIFRLSGSAKRIKDLQAIFNSPDRYGKGLDWTGYTVHDAANILRRYLNQLPEPIVPLEFYERFREPLRRYQARPLYNGEMLPIDLSVDQHREAVVAYQKLITELPPLNRQLLLYILDLLAVFASKSDLNRMTAANLAAIFQPGIISHPNHDMAPAEYRLSQDVLIFLIENQDHFLIGMSGTGVDEQTRAEVEGGVPAGRAPKPKSHNARTPSDASAGADSVRKYGVRRNVSTSSHNSRDRGSPVVTSPGTPTGSYHQAQPSGIVARSNTVPSKRSPAIGAGAARFQARRENSPAASLGQPSPDLLSAARVDSPQQNQPQPPSTPSPRLPAATIGSGPAANLAADNKAAATPAAGNAPPAAGIAPAAGNNNRAASCVSAGSATGASPTASGATVANTVANTATSATSASGSTTAAAPPANRERKISNLFSRSPIFAPADPGKPQRKLQKRRGLPGSANESAENSQTSFQGEDGAFLSTGLISPSLSAAGQADPLANAGAAAPANTHSAKRATSTERPNLPHLQPPRSPALSIRSRSSVTDHSEFDQLDTPGPSSAKPSANQGGEKRKSRWRFSTSAKASEELPLQPPPPIGVNPGARGSNSSIGSSGAARSEGAKGRKSFTYDSRATSAASQILHDSASSQKRTSSEIPVGSLGNRDSNDVFNDGTNKDRESSTTGQAGGDERKGGLFSKWKAKMSEQREKRERAKSPPPAHSFQGYPGKLAASDGSGSEDGKSRTSLTAFAQEHFSSSPIRRSLDKTGHALTGRGLSSGPVVEKSVQSQASIPAAASIASEQVTTTKTELETVKERPLSEATLVATSKPQPSSQTTAAPEEEPATPVAVQSPSADAFKSDDQAVATEPGIPPSSPAKESEVPAVPATTDATATDTAPIEEEKKEIGEAVKNTT
ncbi:hypothetical protein DV738_g2982, partial [Chaetothyriales sp. CBS 135597]